MRLKKLWLKLFSSKTKEEEIALHIAGATVRHKTPFEHLEVPRNSGELTKQFADKWITPYYMRHMFDSDPETINTFVKEARKCKIKDAQKLLGYFDWRSKLTAAYFAAINNYIGLEEIIGNLLLKSEVCDAGKGYCIALGIFGTEK